MNRTKTALLLCSLWLALLWPASRLLAYRDLETGTFLTRDPAGMVDGPNLYAYVNQNPWTKFDPEGLEGYFPRTVYERNGGEAPDVLLLRAAGAWANEHPRTMGGVKAVGSAGEMAVGVAGAMAPTGVTQALGGVAIVHGGDGFQAGVRQAWNGTPTGTFTQQAIAGVAEKSGASPDAAHTIGAVGDGLLGVGVTLGVSATIAPVKSAATTLSEATSETDRALVQTNKAVGDAVRDEIAGWEAPAYTESTLRTLGGDRRIDVLKVGDDTRIGIESKVGSTALTSRVRQELARDWWLKRQGQLDGVRWEFSRSPTTGGVGPSSILQEKLNKLGFETKINK